MRNLECEMGLEKVSPRIPGHCRQCQLLMGKPQCTRAPIPNLDPSCSYTPQS